MEPIRHNPKLKYRWKPKRPVEAREVEAVEAALGSAFSAEYREFLLMGGSLVVGNFIGAETDSIKVSFDLGAVVRHVERSIGVVLHLDSAWSAYQAFTQDMGFVQYERGAAVGATHGRLPPFMFTIAHDNGDGWFLLNVSEENYGSIWYWERKDITFGAEGNTLFGYVARDFAGFIAAIQSEDAVQRQLAELAGREPS